MGFSEARCNRYSVQEYQFCFIGSILFQQNSTEQCQHVDILAVCADRPAAERFCALQLALACQLHGFIELFISMHCVGTFAPQQDFLAG